MSILPPLFALFGLLGEPFNDSFTSPLENRISEVAPDHRNVSMTPIRIEVGLQDLNRSLIHVRQQVSVRPGDLTLVYPKWVPGTHAPKNLVGRIAGLQFSCGGQTLKWRRDDADTHMFHIVIPAGQQELQVAFDVVESSDEAPFNLRWEHLLLYPSGSAASAVKVQARLKLPTGWAWASALESRISTDGAVTFQETNLADIVDSPVLLGPNSKTYDLGNHGGKAHRIHVFSASEGGLQVDEATLQRYRSLISESKVLFGSRHYDHYDFLISLTGSGGGLEHRQCSENWLPEDAFTGAGRRTPGYFVSAYTLAHEYSHSWNGKYRCPKGLATANFQDTMRPNMLWVYEGMTDYFAYLLAARCGLLSMEEIRDEIAYVAATISFQEGRLWRSMEDTTFSQQVGVPGLKAWSGFRRKADYYTEGSLLWLEVDALIRQKSQGKHSLDDFSMAFFGGPESTALVKPYELKDLITDLPSLPNHDWPSFFQNRVQGLDLELPTRALAGCGWRLAWAEEPSTAEQMEAMSNGTKDLNTIFGLGLWISPEGVITDLRKGSPADHAGLGPRMKILGVNGKIWKTSELRSALKRKVPLDLIVAHGEDIKPIHINYSGGLKHPRLERIPNVPDLLTPMLESRVKP